VFALLVVLVGLGAQALRPRTVAVRRMLIVPAVFFVWGAISLAARAGHPPILLLDWLGTAALGAGVGWQMSRLDQFRFDPTNGSVSLPGSTRPLVRNLTIFSAKYAIGVAIALAPRWRVSLVLADIAVSGLSAGYFAGWATRYLLAYRASRSRVPASAIIPSRG
jgi:hypothetical protein